MRERATLFTISAVAILALLFAIERHQKLGRKSTEFDNDRGRLTTRVQDLESQILECSEARDTALGRVQALATEIEGLKTNTGSSSEAIVGKIDALQKEWTEKEAALQAGLAALGEKVAGLDGKVDAAAASVAEVKKEVTAPEAALLAKLDQVAKLSEAASQVPQQLTAMDGKLQALEKTNADVAALSQRLTEVQGSVEAKLQGLETSLAGVSQRATGPSQQLTEMSAAIATLAATLDAQKASLSQLGEEVRKLSLRPAELTGSVRPVGPEGTAVTTTVKAATDAVVVIAAGKADGVELGQSLYVLREGAPVARVRVINAYEHLAGAKIVESVEGRMPQKEDSVTSIPPAGWDTLESETIQEPEDAAGAVSSQPTAPEGSPTAIGAPSERNAAGVPPPPPPPPGS